MGCTDSSTVVQNKPKPVFAMIPNNNVDNHNLLMGQTQQNKYLCLNVNIPKSNQQSLQLIDRPLPQLVNANTKQKFQPPNFAQMIRIGQSSLYIITGGISHKLDHIHSNTYLYNIKSNKVYKLPNLKQGRYTHSSVYIDNWVYVIGGREFGQDDQAILNKCQRLKINLDEDSSDQKIQQYLQQNQLQWKYISSMNERRCSQICVVYNDKIYAIGGYTGQFQRSTIIEYYEYKQKQANKWKILNVQLPFGIQSCTVLANNDNQLTIFGGNTNSGPSDSVLTINLLQGYQSIHSNRKLNSKKILHKIVKSDASVYVLGGNEDMDIQLYKIDNQDNDKISTQQVQPSPKKFSNKISNTNNVLSKYFKSTQDFEIMTQSCSTIVVPFKYEPPSSQYQKSENDEIVYIFGTSTQPFILELNISVPYASYMSVPLSIRLSALQGVVYLPQRKQYLVFGGISDSQEDISKQTFIYNPNNTAKYSGIVAKMITPRYAFGYQKIGDWIYAIGGGSVDEEQQLLILNKCQKINIKTLAKPGSKQVPDWTSIADLPFNIISPMTITHNNKLYVFGGMKQNKERSKNILKYKQKQNIWQQLKFNFPFGLQASSIYHRKQSEYVIFGGRVVNGDTKTIWGLTMINNGQDCVFEQKGQMKQAKCLHHAYKPKHQNFIVILGGQKQILSYYDSDSLKPIQSDILIGMKKIFTASLGVLSDKSLKNYTVAIKE